MPKVARQGDHLDVAVLGAQRLRNGQGVVAAAVVDIHDFAAEPALQAQPFDDLGQVGMQARQSGALIVNRHNDRRAPLRRAAARWRDRRLGVRKLLPS